MTSNQHNPFFRQQPMSFGKKFSTNNLLKRSPSINRNRSNTNLINITQHNNSFMRSVNSNSQESSINIGAIFTQSQVFPQDILILLSQENSNIQNFKQRIQKQKKKINKDFQVFQKQISHMIEDLKSSMNAQLDLVYKTFIEKYAFLKSEVQEIRRLKKQIRANNFSSEVNYISSNCSNLQMVREIQKQTAHFRQYKISQYVQQIQKNKLNPLFNLTRQIISILSSQIQFYNSSRTNTQFGKVKQQFSHITSHMFEKIGEYVKVFNFFEKDIQNNILQEEISKSGIKQFSNDQNYPQLPSQIEPSLQIYNKSPTFKKNKLLVLSKTLQAVKTENIQKINLRPLKNLKPQHSDKILCCFVVQNKYIISGGKDGIINVLTLDGNKIMTLRGHEASICTFALIQGSQQQSYLASGSDHGCSSIILWDIRNWSQQTKLKTHSAAVSAIVDLCDGQTLISGSFDKKINVCNYKKGILLYSLPNNKASVITLVLNSDKDKLISCSLDNLLNIWNIARDPNGIVQSINLERIIKNNFPLFALSCSSLRKDLVVAGSKDGKVKFWNILSGQCQRTLSVIAGPIVDLLLIERQIKPNYPLILSCSTKDTSFVLTHSDNGINQFIEANLQLQFGGGVGPKVLFYETQKGINLCSVKQNMLQKQINIHQVSLLQ